VPVEVYVGVGQVAAAGTFGASLCSSIEPSTSGPVGELCWATGGEIGVAVWALQSNVLSELVVGKENDVTQGTRVLVMKKQMPAELGRRLENKRWRAQCALDSHGF